VSAYSPRLPDTPDAPRESAAVFDDLLRADRKRLALRLRLKHIAGLALQAVLLLILISLFFYRLPQVDGQSMEPQLTGGEHVLIDTLAFDFRVANPMAPDRPIIEVRLHPIAHGDLVAFEHGTGDDRRILLKRVIGLPGDTVAIVRGKVLVDGVPADGYPDPPGDREDLAPIAVPAGSIYVLGDNRAQSDDSRAFGPVPVESVIGRATLVVWPPSRAQRLR
jgi:signal peptidase I